MSITYKLSKGVVPSNGASPLTGSYPQVGTSGHEVDVTLPAASVNTLVAASFGVAGTSSGNLLSITITASSNCTLKTNGTGTSEVQTITVTGTPTGGSLILGFGSAVTAVAFNASAATVQTALQALSTIGSGNVTCTGGPLPGTAITCTFAGALANTNVGTLYGSVSALTGGTPALAIATTVAGAPQDTLSISAGIPVTWDVSGPHAALFAGAVTAFYVTATNACRFQSRYLVA